MRFCVYFHRYNGAVFYVGKGKPYRPFETSRHNQKWNDFVAAIDAYEVEIVLWTNDPDEAAITEGQLIRQLSPACNLMLNGYVNLTKNAAIAAALMGHEVRQETREKVSKARAGIIPNGWNGRHHTEASKAKIRADKSCVPVICNQTGQRFPSVKHASVVMNISKSNLLRHLRGQLRHVSGYTFTKAS